MPEPLLKVENLKVSFKIKKQKTAAVEDVNFSLDEGKIIGIVGESGCGKTVTAKSIMGLIKKPGKIKEGSQIFFQGENVVEYTKKQWNTFCGKECGMIFQDALVSLNPTMKVGRQIIENLDNHETMLSKQEKRTRAQEMLQLVHMEQSANKYPSELSGGQQQRIGVLRALAASPPIVLMDEPFSALDPLTRESLQDEVKNLQQKLNKTIVFVSHDMSEALKLADIIIFMAAGEIVQMASPEEMLEHPANDLVRTFMGKHTPDTAPSKVESFMRTNVFSVRKDRGVLECAERMARGSVDTLLVTDEQNRYLGTVSIGDIRHWGRELTSIEPLVRQTARTVRVGDEAKESFDYLLDSGANYVVVLNADDTIAGIVTKTSVARSVAENLWGDSK